MTRVIFRLYLPPLDLIQCIFQIFFFWYNYLPDCLFDSGVRHDQHIDVLRHKGHERVIFGLKFRKRVLPVHWKCRRHVDGGLYTMWWFSSNTSLIYCLQSVQSFCQQYLQGILPSALHWNLWYNHSLSSSFVFYENKLLGLPRIRQLKVRNNSCVVHEYFRDVIYDCFGEYSESNEDRNSEDDVDNYTA